MGGGRKSRFSFKIMKNGNSTSSAGIGFTGLLAIVFITLKLCKVIAWSWLWVLSPIWIHAALVVVVCIIVGLYFALK